MPGADALDRAIATVLELPSFSALDRAALLHTPTFASALRRATRADLTAADRALESIAEHNDDGAEATGLLHVARAMRPAGALPPASSLAAALDLHDADAFAAGVLGIAREARAQVASDLVTRQIDHGWRVDPEDQAAVVTWAHVRQLATYGLEDAAQARWAQDPWSTYATGVPLERQVHPRLHDVFAARPLSEQHALSEAWWGARAARLTDVLVLCEWEGAGWAEVHRGPAYFEAVTELVIAVARRHTDGMAFLMARRALVADFVEALALPACFAWLASDTSAAVAAHLVSLGHAGLLDIDALVVAIEKGLTKGWGGPREARLSIQQLRAALASPVS